MSDPVTFRAQPGRQREFSQCTADIAIYGGAAGGGKSYALLLEAAKWVHVPGYRAVLFRRVHADLMQEGGLWDDSAKIYPHLGGSSRESPRLQWSFDAGDGATARISFDHLQHDKDRFRKQGLQAAFLGFDELTHFTEEQFWYLIGRMRTTCGVTPYLRGTCNPDPDSFVRKLIDWWIGEDGLPIDARSGVIRWLTRVSGETHWGNSRDEMLARFPDVRPKSFTFIPAKLEDNPALIAAQPDYASNIDAQTRVERERLKFGNWNVRALAGDYFKRRWFHLVDAGDPVVSQVVRWCRCWDLAATEPSESNRDPDWTAGAHVGITSGGDMVIRDITRLRGSPGKVEAAVHGSAQHDGRGAVVGLWQDPGQAGKAQAMDYVRKLAAKGYTAIAKPATKNKETYAKLWSALAEPSADGTPGRVYVVRGPWNDAFFNEAEGFPGQAKHDDQIDAVSRAAVHLLHGSTPVKSFRVRGI